MVPEPAHETAVTPCSSHLLDAFRDITFRHDRRAVVLEIKPPRGLTHWLEDDPRREVARRVQFGSMDRESKNAPIAQETVQKGEPPRECAFRQVREEARDEHEVVP